MSKKKRGPIFIFIGIVLFLAILSGVYIVRVKQKEHFDSLYNKAKILKVEYGIIPQKDLFMEKNALFKRTNQDNYYFLFITSDYTLFTYYLDWYYNLDPLRGYKLVYEMQLNKETVEKIMKSIKEKERDSLLATVESEYLNIYHDKERKYIKKHELQAILQDNNIVLDI